MKVKALYKHSDLMLSKNYIGLYITTIDKLFLNKFAIYKISFIFFFHIGKDITIIN